MSAPTNLDVRTDSALTELVAAKTARDTAELQMLSAAVRFIAEHETTRDDEAAWYDDLPVRLGADGVPTITETAVVNAAAMLGMTLDACKHYLGRAGELAWRLPHTYHRVLAGEVPVWRGLRIAETTLHHSISVARAVDDMVANYAHHIGPAQLDRTLTVALAEFDPDTAEQQRLKSAESRHVHIGLDDAGRYDTHGLVTVEAIIDIDDALDLDTALDQRADQLADLGSTDTRDVRRAHALGDLARLQLAFDYDTGELTTPTGRGVDLVIHLPAHSYATGQLRHTPTHLIPITIDDIRHLVADAAQVTVKPVIDLNTPTASSGYQPSDRVADQVRLTHPTCVFPHCRRPSDHCDLDHNIPWAEPTRGPTDTDNLLPLCRRHHRAKTHHGWTYTREGPTTTRWRSPTGHTFTVTNGLTVLEPRQPLD